MSEDAPKERIIRKIPPPPSVPRLVRAVIYARVSSIHEAQESSLEAQINYFKKLAREKCWFITAIYAERRSAKKSDSRPEFKRMIDDSYCEVFDLVLTKSISRFGRDTVETLQALQKLRGNGVDVFFDLEQLHSIDDRNTHIITVLEAVAQEENRIRSESIKWGIEKSLSKENSKLYQRTCYGYQLGADGVLEIKEAEAEIVRKIFQLYLEGYSILAIIRELEKIGVLSPTGKSQWSKRTIDTLLSNEKYTGLIIRGKTFIAEYPNSKRYVNRGEVKQFHLGNNHTPIISEDQFAKVQAEKARRSNVTRIGDATSRASTHYSMKKAQISNGDIASD